MNVGRKVPRMLPTVPHASIVPTVFPLSVRFPVAYLMREGVTVPSSIRGNTNRTRQAPKDAHTR